MKTVDRILCRYDLFVKNFGCPPSYVYLGTSEWTSLVYELGKNMQIDPGKSPPTFNGMKVIVVCRDEHINITGG